ncbi:hypothetical protein [Cellulosilyticum sp. I15G10I2]|uniref:hypothetical protein n=1 Tax=Cellulosilyticum sp. I15G10I2 TaxID=1892843 RepID=UPI00085BC8B7|nr:hypothetical protein [Cellulosilyticum sp. I15G10I2]
MQDIGFMAVEKFDSSYGDTWTIFVEWSKLYQLRELVSIDCVLCPQVFKPESDDDFENLVPNEMQYSIYKNLEWLILRTGHIAEKQILAVLYKPNME